MSLTARICVTVCLALLSCLPLAPLHADDGRAAEQQHIEEMVVRCNGDKTCELVVRKRETAAVEQRRQRALLKQNDPQSYYFQLWGRYLAFVFAIGAAAFGYVFLMRRLFGRKK